MSSKDEVVPNPLASSNFPAYMPVAVGETRRADDFEIEEDDSDDSGCATPPLLDTDEAPLDQAGGAVPDDAPKTTTYIVASFDPGVVNLGFVLAEIEIDLQTRKIARINVLSSGSYKLDRQSTGYDVHSVSSKTFAEDAAAFVSQKIVQPLKNIDPSLMLNVIIETQYINAAAAGIGMKLKAVEVAVLSALTGWSLASGRSVFSMCARTASINSQFQIKGSKQREATFRVKALQERKPELWKLVAKDDGMTTHEADCWWQVLSFLASMSVVV